MCNIAGFNYTLVGHPQYIGLSIGGLQSNGDFINSSLSDGTTSTDISGNYNEATGKVTFNDAIFPGSILTTTLFSGQAVCNPDNTILLMYGDWTEQELTFDDRKLLKLAYREAAWVAINPVNIIV